MNTDNRNNVSRKKVGQKLVTRGNKNPEPVDKSAVPGFLQSFPLFTHCIFDVYNADMTVYYIEYMQFMLILYILQMLNCPFVGRIATRAIFHRHVERLFKWQYINNESKITLAV